METQFIYTITKKDLVDYYHLILFEKQKKLMMKIPLLLIVSYLLFLYLMIVQTLLLLSVLTILITLVLSLLVLTPIFIHFHAKRIYEKNKFLQYENHYIMDDKKVSIKTKHKETNMYWHDLIEVKESRHNLYCVFTNHQVLYIPKSKIQVEKFIDFLKDKSTTIAFFLIQSKRQSI